MNGSGVGWRFVEIYIFFYLAWKQKGRKIILIPRLLWLFFFATFVQDTRIIESWWISVQDSITQLSRSLGNTLHFSFVAIFSSFINFFSSILKSIKIEDIQSTVKMTDCPRREVDDRWPLEHARLFNEYRGKWRERMPKMRQNLNFIPRQKKKQKTKKKKKKNKLPDRSCCDTTCSRIGYRIE